MKNIILLSILSIFLFATCTKSSLDDFEIVKDKINNTSGGGSGSTAKKCPYGKWGKPAVCSSNPTPPISYFYFGDNGVGYSSNPDCNGICSDVKFNFTFTVSSGTINYVFTQPDDVICNGVNQGAPNKPVGNFSISYTCSSDGKKLTIQTTGGVQTFDKY